MTTQKTKDRQITAQANASLRLLKRLANSLDKQLTKTVHPIITRFDVMELVFNAEAMSEATHHLCFAMGFTGSENETAVIELFTAPEGAATAREHCKLTRELSRLAHRWEEGKRQARVQLNASAASALNLHHRSMNEQFAALVRQAQSHENFLQALLYTHYLQFWMWEGKLHYAGQPEAKVESK